MAFQKYNVKDNAFSTLLVGISAGALSLELQASDGDKFPASNFIATLVQYETPGDETSAVVKREKVLVTNNATDTFTITRGFDGDTPVSFEAGDFVYLNVVSAIIEDIQTETARLETDKLDSSTYNSTTRDSLTAYRLLYIDGTGNETQLALGTAGQVLISQGTTSNPIWQAPTLDIDGLTNDDTLGANDKLVFYKDGTGNRKRTAKASETVEGLVERATEAEVLAKTDTTRYISPAGFGAGMKDSIGSTSSFSAGTTIEATQNGFVYIAVQADTNDNISGDLLINGTRVGGVVSDGNNSRMPSSVTYPVKKGDTYRFDLISDFGNILYLRRFIPMG